MNQVDGNVFLLEQELHDLVGDHRERFQHALPGALDGVGHVGGDGLVTDVFTFVAVEIDRLAVDEVDHALKRGLGADGQLKRDGRQPELGLELLNDADGIRAGAVHLVDEGDPRHGVPFHLAIDGDRLRLNASHRAKHKHRAIEHAERPFDLDGEIDVARRVDDVDLLVFPVDRGGRRGDGDPSFLLQLHVVHHRPLTLDLLDHVGAAGVIQNALGERGLARVNVSGDPNISVVSQVFHSPGLLSQSTNKGWNALWPGQEPRDKRLMLSGKFNP